jgi:outer membrane lipoprotein SlyB
MAERLKNLAILSLNGCANVGDESMAALAKNCPKLQSLSLFSLRITDISVDQITQGCRYLVSLSISGCSQVTDVGASTISRLIYLQSLYLNSAAITDYTIIKIAEKCHLIRALSLNECRNLTDASIVFLSKQCKQIQSLSMNECSVTAVGVKALVDRCLDLRELSIKSCSKCFLTGSESKHPVSGNGGLSSLHAVGEEVLAKINRRKIALMT